MKKYPEKPHMSLLLRLYYEVRRKVNANFNAPNLCQLGW